MLDVKLQRKAGFGLSSPAPMSRYDIDGIATALRTSRDITHNIRHGGRIRTMPSRDALGGIVADLSAALFPSHYGQSQSAAAAFDGFVCGTLSTSLGLLEDQVRLGLAFADEDPTPGSAAAKALDITRAFAAALPGIRASLVGDLRAALDGDPAASSAPEILLGYPGMAALVHHRMAHVLHGLGAGFPARLISDVARSLTGIEIHPGATIGDSFFIDHGTGVVIGETAVVGHRVRLHQGVTLGARHAPAGVALRGVPRHPVLEDDVVIDAGATLLGRITVGRGSIVGGNVCLTASVPPGSRVTQASAFRGGSEGQRLSE